MIMTEIVIYSKPGCHLCEDAKLILAKVGQDCPFRLVEVDILQDPLLEKEFGYDIPVIFINGRKAFKHRLTEQALRQKLDRIGR